MRKLETQLETTMQHRTTTKEKKEMNSKKKNKGLMMTWFVVF